MLMMQRRMNKRRARQNRNQRRNLPTRPPPLRRQKRVGINSGPRVLRNGRPAPVNLARQIRNTASGTYRITHTELIVQDVRSSVEYSATPLIINPGLPTAFPWLSAMAPLFQKYTFESLTFRFVSFANTQETGNVLMRFDYNPNDAVPENINSFMMNEPSVSVSTWQQIRMNIPQSHLTKRRNLYTRSTPIPSGSDPILYDIGTLNYGAIGNSTDNTLIGNIYVDYVVAFTMPQSYQPNSDLYVNVEGADGQDAAYPFGSDWTNVVNGDYPPAKIVSQRAFKFNRYGNFLVTAQVAGTGITVVDINSDIAGGSTIVAEPVTYNAAGTLATGFSYLLNASPTTLISLDVTATTVTRATFIITPLDYNFVPL